MTLLELRRGDTCVITVERNAYLLVKVVGTKPAENILIYTPAILRTVLDTEYVAAGDDVYECTFRPARSSKGSFLRVKIISTSGRRATNSASFKRNQINLPVESGTRRTLQGHYEKLNY